MHMLFSKYLIHKEKYTHIQTSPPTIASDSLSVCQAGTAKLPPAGSILTFPEALNIQYP